MNIQQLSNNIDQKLALLEQQLAALDARHSTTSDSDQWQKDKIVLEQIKHKLKKSQAIMWQAHALQNSTDQYQLQRKRWVGIMLCIISGVGIIALILLAIKL